MKTIAGTTFTEPGHETNDILTRIQKHIIAGMDPQKAGVALKGIVFPMCIPSHRDRLNNKGKRTSGRQYGGCGRGTGYIVVLPPEMSDLTKTEAPMAALKEGWAFYISRGRKYLLPEDGMVYIPVQMCHCCSAEEDGTEDGFHAPHMKDQRLADLAGGPLTDKEKEEYTDVYMRSYRKGKDIRMGIITKKRKRRERYEMR